MGSGGDHKLMTWSHKDIKKMKPIKKLLKVLCNEDRRSPF